MPQPLLDRLDDLLRRIDAGGWEAIFPSAYMRHTRAALASVRDTIASHPEDWPDRITPQYLHEEIGYWLMEAPPFVETDVGRDVLQIRIDLDYRSSIARALRTVNETAEAQPAEPALRKMESLLVEMSQAFDADLHRDEARLSRLGATLRALRRGEARHLDRGRMEEDLMAVTLLSLEPEEPDETSPEPSIYESRDPRVTLDISHQLELNRERGDDPSYGDAEVIAPCVRRATWGDQGLEVEWQDPRWGTDVYRWDDLADAGYTFLDLAVSEGVVTGIATGGLLVRTKAGAWFVISANGERYQDLAHAVCGHVWNQRAEAEGAAEDDAAPEDDSGDDADASAAAPWSRPKEPQGRGRSIVERLDRVLRRIDERDPDLAALSPAHAPSIIAALRQVRDLLVAHPEDWHECISPQDLTWEITSRLMETVDLASIDLGKTIVWTINDLHRKLSVMTALKVVHSALSAHPSDKALHQIESLVAGMNEAFDEGFYPDRARLRQLGESLLALIEGQARHLDRGELGEQLGRLIALTPMDPE